jgi:cell division protein FtsL
MHEMHVRIYRITLSMIVSLLVAANCVAARTYLEQALDLMEQHALNKRSIDWPRLRAEAMARATHAKVAKSLRGPFSRIAPPISVG